MDTVNWVINIIKYTTNKQTNIYTSNNSTLTDQKDIETYKELSTFSLFVGMFGEKVFLVRFMRDGLTRAVVEAERVRSRGARKEGSRADTAPLLLLPLAAPLCPLLAGVLSVPFCSAI